MFFLVGTSYCWGSNSNPKIHYSSQFIIIWISFWPVLRILANWIGKVKNNSFLVPLPNFISKFTLSRFSRPILHGLCTLGFAVRAIIRCICGGDPDIVKSISGRLLLHVYPGETLITEMWLEGLRCCIMLHSNDLISVWSLF